MTTAILRWAMLLAGVSFSTSSQAIAQVQFPGPRADAVPNVVLVQFTDDVFPQGKRSGLALFDAIANSYGVYAMEPAFPHLSQVGVSCDNVAKLSNTYRVYFSEDAPPEILALALESDPGVAYAEAEYYFKVASFADTSTPNDPRFPYQATYMDRLQLEEAWDTVKGEQGEVVVAILDSGTDWRHEDLIANVWTNTGEIPDNGIDDDNNGYIDDVHGYDFGNRLPYTPGVTIDLTSNNHGTAVAGATSAESSNGKGIAGSSWNAAYMPLGADCGDGAICNASEGILYAAANGADIINGSFSGRNYDRTQHLAVQCATEMGTLFVAGAGNDATNNDVMAAFPASLFETLAVGGTLKDWDRVVFNYGATVDVYAAGREIALTAPNNEYIHLGGTSFASPLVAGIAALVKTRFPHFSAEQVREQLRYTAESIENVNPPGLKGLLGRGRVNAYSAVQAPITSAIRPVGGGIIRDSTNDSSPSLVVELKSFFENETGQSAIIQLAGVPSYMEFASMSQRINFPAGIGENSVVFPFNYSGDVPYRVTDQIEIRAIHDAGAEKVVYRFESRSGETLPVVKLREHSFGAYSITSEGNLGFLDRWGNSAGIGIELDETPGVGVGGPQLYEAGLILGTGPDQISSSVIGIGDKRSPITRQPIHFNRKPGTRMGVSEPDIYGIVSTEVTLLDSNAPNPIGVEVLEETQLVALEPRQVGAFIVVKYTITNPLQEPIENLHVGLYADWLLTQNWANDEPRFDVERDAIYQVARGEFVANGGFIPGMKILSEDFDTRYGALPINGIFPDRTWNEIMWEYLSGENRLGFPSRDNWSHMASAGPIRLGPGAQEEVVFALALGKYEAGFLRQIDEAVDYYKSSGPGVGLVQIINMTRATLELYLDNSSSLFTRRMPFNHSSDYLPIGAGSRMLRVSEYYQNNDANPRSFVSNLEVTGGAGHQVIFYDNADGSQIHSMIACCARHRATSEDIVTLRAVNHGLMGRPTLDVRFISDQGFVENIQVNPDTVSSYINLPPDKYSLEISKDETPFMRDLLDSEIDLRNFGGGALSAVFRDLHVAGDDGLEMLLFGTEYGWPLFHFQRVNHTSLSSETEQSKLPQEFALHGNYPNPVNSNMQIYFDSPYSTRVSLEIIDLLGRRIREVSAGDVDAGFGTSITVDTRGLGSGVYLYRLTAQSDAGTFTDAGKFIVVR